MNMSRNVKRRSRYKIAEDDNYFDWGIILVVLLLAIIGLSSLYAAQAHEHGTLTTMGVIKPVLIQGAWWVLGTIAILVIVKFDSEQLWKIAPFVYGLGIFLLIMVLIFYSRSMAMYTGAKSWFAFGPLTFQPSEVMKPAFILMLSRVVTEHNRQFPVHTFDTDIELLIKMAAWFLPVAILVALQNDLGTLLVFLAIFAGTVLVSGITWRILAPTFIVGAILGTTMLALVTTTFGRAILGKLGFQAYQFARVDAWLHPNQDTSNTGYQLWQNLKAIGSGQLTGQGWGNLKVYVPVRESDMIFSVVGESFGFLGGAFLIFLYFILIYLMIRVTFDTQNAFYAYISTGVVMMILFHVFENIGMSIGLLPLTGIPLPFVSQGGSSLLSNLIGIGLVLSMRYQNSADTFSEATGFNL